MVRNTIAMLVVAAGLSVAGTCTDAMARGGGGHGGGLGMHSTFNPLVQEMIPRITPQFNSPGRQLAPLRSGFGAGPGSLLPEWPSSAFSEAGGGGREPNVSKIPRKQDPSDAAMMRVDRQLDHKLESEICRGC